MSIRLPRLGRRGSAALEFAIIGPAFLALAFGALEIFYINIVKADLQEASTEAARLMQTSPSARASVTDTATFQTLSLCQYSVVVDCHKATISLTPVLDYKASVASSPPFSAAGTPNYLGVNTGATGQLMLMRVYYPIGLPTWPINVPIVVVTQAYQNENS